MKRKVIIITRKDSNYDDVNYPLGILLKDKSQVTHVKQSIFASLNSLSQYRTIEPDVGIKYAGYEMAHRFKIEIDTSWLEGRVNTLVIPKETKQLFDRIVLNPDYVDDSEFYYDIVTTRNYQVYLCYWDQVRNKVDNLWQRLAIIFKDCEIDVQTPITNECDKNLLYIHDDEWGIEGNHLLMKDPKILLDSNRSVLELLKPLFGYVATFQHTNVEGLYFNHILNLKFGEDQISDVLGGIEDDVSITDFIQLRNKMLEEVNI